ncbi:MAG: hypothetical protein COT81_00075 [Candidatus Buchananbacteria bacterium CG10_big_fil_rev_8_21_14_0_10_42_9]|uniref:Uncharacterized protein n=1 Tax=Candidatus Buchananbacteria bacterium CG10_big_fil_rev_8_21_14_0_10_42_9 TaxID=1974526 RepID=A0A2H0W2N4_9BACT|nr:MAG: hypothetical protein COT81_00075 [Candidatus Buchananbacteria bacterium CG10_big_fil_rev_8_21_14_0_10_42_9]
MPEREYKPTPREEVNSLHSEIFEKISFFAKIHDDGEDIPQEDIDELVNLLQQMTADKLAYITAEQLNDYLYATASITASGLLNDNGRIDREVDRIIAEIHPNFETVVINLDEVLKKINVEFPDFLSQREFSGHLVELGRKMDKSTKKDDPRSVFERNLLRKTTLSEFLSMDI